MSLAFGEIGMIINDIEFNIDLIDLLTELKSQLNANGIDLLGKLKSTKDDVMVCCPYHKNGQERRPSAGIRKSDGLFHCFACGETHSLQEVISYCFGQSDIVGTFGWQWLLKNFKSISTEERKDVKLDFSRPNYSRMGNKVDNNNCNNNKFVSEEELDKYRYIHPYMYERRLNDYIIEMFDLGYDASTESIVFPVKDINGNCLFIARRSVNSKFFNYPAGVEKPLYGLYEYNRAYPKHNNMYWTENRNWVRYPDLIVCESMLDALTCWVYGRPAVALNGLGNKLAIEQLKQLECRKIILATDKDEAGRQARIRLRKEIKNKIITEFDYNSYPKHAKDINDMSKDEFDNLTEIF